MKRSESEIYKLIRCPIHGSIPLDKREVSLIDSPFFQRLRYISQLGFASLVFPGAVHTRFAHSIGTAHLAGRVFDQLLRRQNKKLQDSYNSRQLTYFRRILRFSALLHDLGHPPFSHAAESLLPDYSALQPPEYLGERIDRQATHEDFSHRIIHNIAQEEGLLTKEEAFDIISILKKTIPPSDRLRADNGDPLIFPLLCQLINGEIDVDRMDYLLRDAYFAGVPYGRFDLDRMIHSFSISWNEQTRRFLLAIDGGAVPTYENYLLARVHMFNQIYFHKSLGAYGYYLKMAIDENEIDIRIDGSLPNFLRITENSVTEAINRNQRKPWSGRIANRIPAKNLIRVMDTEKEKRSLYAQIKSLLQKKQIEIIESHSSNQFSSQQKHKPVDHDTIMVVDEEFGRPFTRPLADCSTLLTEKEKRIEIFQLYVHHEDYDIALKAIKKQNL